MHGSDISVAILSELQWGVQINDRQRSNSNIKRVRICHAQALCCCNFTICLLMLAKDKSPKAQKYIPTVVCQRSLITDTGGLTVQRCLLIFTVCAWR